MSHAAKCSLDCIRELLPNLAAAGLQAGAVAAVATTGGVATPLMLAGVFIAAHLGLNIRKRREEHADATKIEAALGILRKRAVEAHDDHAQITRELDDLGIQMKFEASATRRKLAELEGLVRLQGKGDDEMVVYLRDNQDLIVSMGRFLEDSFEELRGVLDSLPPRLDELKASLADLGTQLGVKIDTLHGKVDGLVDGQLALQDLVRKVLERQEPNPAHVADLVRTNPEVRRAVEAALGRAQDVEAAGGAEGDKARSAIDAVRRTGDVTKLTALLETEAESRLAKVLDEASEYVEICRELAALAIVRGDSTEARGRTEQVLRFFADDAGALVMLGDLLMIHGETAGALARYQAAELAIKSWPGSVETERALSVSHERIGNVLVAQGDGEGALKAYREGMAMRAALAKADPRNTEWQRDMAVSLNKIGDVLRAQGDGDGALRAYREGMAIAAALAEADPKNTEWQRDVSVCYNRIGDVLVAQGDGDAALRAYREDMAIAAALAKADPRNAQWQRDVSVSHNKIGDVLVAQGDRDGALKAYWEGMAIAAALVKADPRNTQWQRDVSVSHNKIGDLLRSQGDDDGALKAYREGMVIRAALAKDDPRNTERQRDVSVSHERIGDVLVAKGDRDGALKAYKDGMAIATALAQTDPRNAEWQRDVAVSHNKIGDVSVAQGDHPRALRAYRKGMAIAATLAKADPRNTQWRRDVAVSHSKIGLCLKRQGDAAGAMGEFEAGRTIMERLTRLDPSNAQWLGDLAWFESVLR